MTRIASFDFVRLHADDHGHPKDAAELDAFVQAASSGRYTDALLIAHGFRNSEEEATALYTRFAEGFDAHRAHPALSAVLASRRVLVAGVYWPSKKFDEGDDDGDGSTMSLGDDDDRASAEAQLERFLEGRSAADIARVRRAFTELAAREDDIDAQDRFVDAVLHAVPFHDSDGTEGLAQIRSRSGAEVLASLEAPIFLPTARDTSEGGVASVRLDSEGDDGGVLMLGGFFRSVMGRAGQVLNMGTWYTMKKRSGDVGAGLVADAVRRIGSRELCVHLVGHSLGGRVMASAARALAAAPSVPVESLSLLEAAFSHYGFSARVAHDDKPGYFRDVIAQHVVRGTLIATHSYQDTVVGRAYAIASRLAGDSVKAVGDKDDRFGGIGRNGTQATSEASSQPLLPVGGSYLFGSGIVNNIDGSGGGILNHSDVTNERVTYAVASAVATAVSKAVRPVA